MMNTLRFTARRILLSALTPWLTPVVVPSPPLVYPLDYRSTRQPVLLVDQCDRFPNVTITATGSTAGGGSVTVTKVYTVVITDPTSFPSG